LVAYEKLLASDFFSADDTVVLFNTGSGLKYLDVLDTKDARTTQAPASHAIAGIIGPY
jgi:threonine synthase